MGWTSPRTYVSGEVVTAAIMNADHRDNLNAMDLALLGGLDYSTSQVVDANSAGVVALYTYNIAANLIGASQGLRLVAGGTWLNNYAASTVALTVVLGGDQLLTGIANLGGAGTVTGRWTLDVWFMNAGSQSSQKWGAVCTIIRGTNAKLSFAIQTDAAPVVLTMGSGYNTTTQNCANALSLALWAMLSAANANLSITKEYAFLTRLGAL